MSDDDFEEDDVESAEDIGPDADEDLPEAEADDGDAPVKPRKKAASTEDELAGLSLEAKAREREMLAKQMEEFLARGGRVQEINDDVVSDPPKKPDSKYGSRPI
ncbi:hypothetical protein [Halopseudomonas yangmingensis]|uniref:Transcriptional regulator SutA RNAP-binding domain-containing protein n=1 Tax=Halopseudomonas yangmingensis TaxID=1720063 RepID=A0A1I4PIP3_9GAMM|nr:hypothetical protein [Halopseudomonas yangmingensis]SFM27701.1 hypothetical protein SAMN05216217_102367 [Halopseudomonas yangmingensis]